MSLKFSHSYLSKRSYVKRPFCVWFIFCLFALLAINSSAQSIPEYQGFVTDELGLLSQRQKKELETYLTEQAETSSNEIAVVIMNLPSGVVMRDYAFSIAEKWGLGGKENDNGVLVALFLNAREVDIEVGYGLEGAIPDLAAYNVIQKDMIPYFRQEDYFGGMYAGVKALSTLAKGEYPDAVRRRYYSERVSRGNQSDDLDSFVFFLILFIFLFFLFSSRGGGGGGIWRRVWSKRTRLSRWRTLLVGTYSWRRK